MPDSSSHFRQAERNLKVVEVLNSSPEHYWDWQVTALFYSALHLINGHIMETDGGFYNTHASVQSIIYFNNTGSKAKLPREVGVAYEKLQLLSRKARYLYDPEGRNLGNPQFVGADGFEKAVYAYEIVCKYITQTYNVKVDSINISCLKAGWEKRSLPL
ncbi:MAG: hypothetical protein JNL57_06955 [Bacteroidetes bacterium]|nr:hypothetical protein [Bacteroidota bacterium]